MEGAEEYGQKTIRIISLRTDGISEDQGRIEINGPSRRECLNPESEEERHD